MTFRERLSMDHPECINVHYFGGCQGCPEDYGYSLDSYGQGCNNFGHKGCRKCWDREITRVGGRR